MQGQVNPGYEASPDDDIKKPQKITSITIPAVVNTSNITKEDLVLADKEEEERAQWGNGLEFLMSCIAMSVGLGNVWRFPFTAYENGGGAFLIPYIIVLFFIGRPLYYMEMILGQFASRGPIKIYNNLSPAFVGVGYGQIVATLYVATYYCSLMALTLYFMLASFTTELPWAKCNPDWGDICFDSTLGGNHTNATDRKSSSELYFYKTVLNELPNVDNGIGWPEWRLTSCLLLSWICVFCVAMHGVKSSGKAAYFLALFPYVIMIALLIRAVTLPGAIDGIIFFIKPQWEMLIRPEVWYAAVTQAFFSLGICFGTIVMYSSYNTFGHNVNRDAMVVSGLDTFTSLLAGATIFGILGNLAYESGEPITKVVKGGTGLAFVSYPDAIAKFNFAPQLFSVLFFFMLFILGVGSLVALQGNLATSIKDQFPKLKEWHISGGLALLGFVVGLIYTTPGGQYMLNLVDYFGGTFAIFVLAIFEIVCIAWVYGIHNFCIDAEYMLKVKIGLYWRICWGLICPVMLIVIFLYALFTIQPLTYNGVEYPTSLIVIGWILLFAAIIQIPLWAVWILWKNIDNEKTTTFSAAFGIADGWGPKNLRSNQEWREFRAKANLERSQTVTNRLTKIKYAICRS